MATIVMHLKLEAETVLDAIVEVEAVYLALPHRHGEQFRALERRIDALLAEDAAPPLVSHIGQGVFVASPPTEMVQIIADAKALGLI